jgi:squalene synthase HpnC
VTVGAALAPTVGLGPARAENFPVALRLLPARHRRDLLGIYALARSIDDLGDDPARPPLERLARLEALAAELPELVATRFDGRLPVDPFLDLVAANRLDQQVSRQPTYADLRSYCALSADPVGRLVLVVFGRDEPRLHPLSDAVCTALQILEHCQDVREDYVQRDRVYLPQEDLLAFAVEESDLAAANATGAVRRLIAFETERAVGLLENGRSLVSALAGYARVAVAGYVAGGYAAAAALRRSGFDPLPATPTVRRRDVLTEMARLLARKR